MAPEGSSRRSALRARPDEIETKRPAARPGSRREPSGESREPARSASAGVPWRALAVGVLLLPLLTHFGHLSYIIAQSAVWTAQTLLRGPVVLLFLLACWSLAWRRI